MSELSFPISLGCLSISIMIILAGAAIQSSINRVADELKRMNDLEVSKVDATKEGK